MCKLRDKARLDEGIINIRIAGFLNQRTTHRALWRRNPVRGRSLSSWSVCAHTALTRFEDPPPSPSIRLGPGRPRVRLGIGHLGLRVEGLTRLCVLCASAVCRVGGFTAGSPRKCSPSNTVHVNDRNGTNVFVSATASRRGAADHPCSARQLRTTHARPHHLSASHKSATLSTAMSAAASGSRGAALSNTSRRFCHPS